MNLAELEQEDGFALLGPGFGGRPFTLLRGLVSAHVAPAAGPWLAHAAFEQPGNAPQLWVPATEETVEPELAGAGPGPARVMLAAPGHAEKVHTIREAIAAGDVYQVCLTARARVEARSAAGLLAALCGRGIPRFAAWVRLPGGVELVSASPEMFFRVQGSRVHAEPMKGTARPDAGGTLAASEKDRCELAMITDLLRNDLVPVCRARSVRVENDRRVIPLPYALQTVSDVTGELLPGTTALDVLAALHPGGSVTGAPKQAALSMIRALEPGPRGAYCGALGVGHGPAAAVFSLLIRTAVRQPGDADWVYGVGGGIVMDSDPAEEWNELHVKLGALPCAARS